MTVLRWSMAQVMAFLYQASQAFSRSLKPSTGFMTELRWPWWDSW